MISGGAACPSTGQRGGRFLRRRGSHGRRAKRPEPWTTTSRERILLAVATRLAGLYGIGRRRASGQLGGLPSNRARIWCGVVT